MSEPNISTDVSKLISLTESCSCDDLRLDHFIGKAKANALENILLGKLISDKQFSIFAVRDIIAKAWRTVHRVEVRKLDKNLF